MNKLWIVLGIGLIIIFIIFIGYSILKKHKYK